MSEEPTSPAEAGETGPVAGERLAAARRARDISLDEIARELHLDGAKVQALEQNNFGRLGAPVFVKGYLRKYASLVGLSGEDVLADYERLHPTDTVPPLIGLRARPKSGNPAGPWIVTVAVLGVAAALGAWWWFASEPAVIDRGSPAAGPAPSVEQAEPEASGDRPPLDGAEEIEAPAVAPVDPPEVEEAPPRTAVTDSPDAAEPEPQDQPAAERVPVSGQVALQLSFSGDCWTEVTDAGGDRLYFGLGTAGRTVTVEGEPPLQVLVGDSDNVRVTVDGAPYTIPRSARRGDTARFTVTP